MSLAEQIMPEDYIFPPKPAPLSDDEKLAYKERIKSLLKEKDAVLQYRYTKKLSLINKKNELEQELQNLNDTEFPWQFSKIK